MISRFLLNPVLKLLKRDYDYDDPEQVVINTNEGGFELSIQNDASFIQEDF